MSSEMPDGRLPLHPARAGLGVLAFLCMTFACGGGEGSSAGTDPDTLTRRQKDSLISTMPIPGAGAVGRALDAADKAEERAKQLDTIG